MDQAFRKESANKKMGQRCLAFFLFGFLILYSSGGWAQEQRFSVSINAGIYQPSLRTLNRILGDPHRGILQDPNYLLPRNIFLPAEVRNIVSPQISGKTNYGLEAQWEATDDFSLVATLSVWQGESIANDVITTFIRQDLPPIQAPRSARYAVSISQLWLGWKYNVLRDPERGRIFINVGLVGISLADFNLDTLFKIETPEQSFASTSSVEARGLAYTTRLGIGGEYYLTEWFSVGFNANYVVGTITKLKVKRHFRQNFSDIPIPPSEAVQPPAPSEPETNEVISHADVQTENITDICNPSAPPPLGPFGTCGPGAGEPLRIELNGLQLTGTLRFYF